MSSNFTPLATREPAAPDHLRLDDWRILRARKWDWHDQNLIVRPYVDALVAEIERLRAAPPALQGLIQACQKLVSTNAGVKDTPYGQFIFVERAAFDAVEAASAALHGTK